MSTIHETAMQVAAREYEHEQKLLVGFRNAMDRAQVKYAEHVRYHSEESEADCILAEENLQVLYLRAVRGVDKFNAD